MKVTMLLADSAQAINNKLYILGGGWSIIGPDPTPMAIAIKIEVPWDQTNRQHHWDLSLLTADGDPVTVPTPEGDAPVKIEGDFEVGRPPGIHPGTPIDLSVAINVGPLPIPPTGRYQWRLSIGDRTDEDWILGFTTRPSPQSGTQ